MDAERARIEADLRGLVAGDVDCDRLHTQLYASDASLYEVMPLGVVRPRHTQDVVEVVRYAAENRIPLAPRGGGSGLAGQSLGPGLVLDFSKYMRRLVEIDVQGERIRVQPGLVVAELNNSLQPHGLLFGPDPATRAVSCVGSAIAINASGSHYPVYGAPVDLLESVQMVLADGELVQLGAHRSNGLGTSQRRVAELVEGFSQLVANSGGQIPAAGWQGVTRELGYPLERAWQPPMLDLAKLQAGAEGTLGILTEATLRVHPAPKERGVVLLFFDRLENAARSGLVAAQQGVAACDLMDRRLLEIARESDPLFEQLVPKGAEAMLLVEVQGEEAGHIRLVLAELVERLRGQVSGMTASRITTNRRERNQYWKLSRRMMPRLYQLKGTTRPLPFIEDIAVAPERLPDFLSAVQQLLRQQRVTASLFAHVVHGQVHLRPFMDPTQASQRERMERLAETVFGLVLEFQGVISGEQAVGLSRSWFSRQQLGDRYGLCRRIKHLFDPEGILNPGKLISDSPQRLTDNLRRLTRPAAGELPVDLSTPRLGDALTPSPTHVEPSGQSSEQPDWQPLLHWPQTHSLPQVTADCNGCGRCRTTALPERMCPVFRATRAEEASPRAKANVMRGLLSGNLEPAMLETDELKQLADLCFNCHQCRVDCPASVDIPKLVLEIKAQYVASQGLRLDERLMGRIDLWVGLASRWPWLANTLLSQPRWRWLLEKTTGIARGRRLPRIAKQPFLRWAQRQQLTTPGRGGGKKVLYLADHYANWHNPLVGRSVVEVLRHQQVEVFVPPNQHGSRLAMISSGDVSRARKQIEPFIRRLADYIRQGYQIVTHEPSMLLCLRHEYLNLIDDEDSRLVASHSQEIGQYLWGLHQQNQLQLDFRPLTMSVLYHRPCHLRVLDPEESGRRLLTLIPGLMVLSAEAGCSGMAGTFGMLQRNYRQSLRIGWGLISKMQQTEAQVGTTECSGCKLQMEQGVDKVTLPPVSLLALAYGRLPEVRDWLAQRHSGLLVQ